MKGTAFAAVLTLAAPAAASDFVLAPPIDCTLGDTCHIRQFMDRDPGPGAKDYRCGTLSYDGHKGTDFGLPTLAEMRAGVAVLAAAPGVVAALRDGMSDVGLTESTAPTIEGRECGNGVVLRHEGGYETQYCHMKFGSITVQEGQKVTTGTALGQVGLSGRTQFPHVHLSVRLNGQEIDPFDAEMTETCSESDAQLWQDTLPYQPGGLLAAGFAPAMPDYDKITDGTAAKADLPNTAPALVLFGLAFGGQKGDEMTIDITGPEGPFLRQTVTLDKDQAQLFRAAGKRLTAARWPSGTYRGIVTMTRAGAEIDRTETTVNIR